MHYKTIMLELLQQQTELHEALRVNRQVLTVLEAAAAEFKAVHEHWKEQLTDNLNIDPGQRTAIAMEYAQHEMEARLQNASTQIEHGTPSLDSILALVRSPMSPS